MKRSVAAGIDATHPPVKASAARDEEHGHALGQGPCHAVVHQSSPESPALVALQGADRSDARGREGDAGGHDPVDREAGQRHGPAAVDEHPQVLEVLPAEQRGVRAPHVAGPLRREHRVGQLHERGELVRPRGARPVHHFPFIRASTW